MRGRVVLAVLALTVACGVKGKPLAPELVQPTPPSGLVAKSLTEGIRLTWRRPTEYSGGKHMRDLAGFDVERADGDVATFAKVGTVELTDQTRFQQEKSITWTDTSAVAGTTHRYRVVARTLDGYRSVPSEPVTLEHRAGATAEAPPPPKEPEKKKKKKRPAAPAAAPKWNEDAGTDPT
jgi:hypothetical protein